jgi:hypothetical protein
MEDNQQAEQPGIDRAVDDDDIAAILAQGEAGVGTAMRAVEAVEPAYYSAVDATTTTPRVATTSTAW